MTNIYLFNQSSVNHNDVHPYVEFINPYTLVFHSDILGETYDELGTGWNYNGCLWHVFLDV